MNPALVSPRVTHLVYKRPQEQLEDVRVDEAISVIQHALVETAHDITKQQTRLLGPCLVSAKVSLVYKEQCRRNVSLLKQDVIFS